MTPRAFAIGPAPEPAPDVTVLEDGPRIQGFILAFADVAHRGAFGYIGNQIGGYGDTRARELTMALRVAIGV